jgi:hypothetical protein
MLHTKNRASRWTRGIVVGGMLAAAMFASACEEFLTATNPGLIQENRLADTSLVDLMANSAVGALQDVYSWMADYGSVYTDETRNHGTFFEEGLYDQRRLQPDNGTLSTFHYAPLMRARWLADSLTARIRSIYGDSANHDLRVARGYAIAGFDLVILGEYFCEVPVPPPGERYSAPLKPDSLFGLAIARFDSAIKIAAASKEANQKVTSGPTLALAQRLVLGADSVRNFALVAKARAALNKGDKSLASSTAQQVTSMGGATEFEYRVYYNDNASLNLINRFQPDFSGGGGVTIRSITGTRFIGLDDARVPHPINATTGQPLPEAATGGNWVVPNAGASFSSFNNTKAGADFAMGTSIRVASMLEARYIIAEAGGAAGTNIGGQSNVAFVESRRSGSQSTTTPNVVTAANYTASLMEQRSRDFFLDGHRMGDLRRYRNKNATDLWEKGAMYGGAVTFNDQTCWPMNVAEITNNPFVVKPYTSPLH